MFTSKLQVERLYL